MYKSFETMPDFSRLWIYQANRKFTESDKILLEQGLRNLCDHWSAHGTPLETSYHISHDQFVILSVNEQQVGASGCSIDGSVRLLKSLQQEAGIDFFDRGKVAFLIDGKVVLHPLADMEKLFLAKVLSEETMTFDNTITSRAEWEGQWKIQTKKTWLVRYLPNATVGKPTS